MRKNRCLFILVLFQVFSLQLFNTIASGETVTYEADYLPWSGYWWPYSSGGLATGRDYRGQPAPLEKYETLTEGRTPGALLSWYKKKYYDPEAKAWYGLCGAWAMASAYERVDFYPSSEENIIFRVGDKKGLLTLQHQKDVPLTGDGTRPDVFHEWLLRYLAEEKLPFVADLDSGEEIWNYPIYKAEIETRRNGDTEEVSATIYYVTNNVEPDFTGTVTRKKYYTYNLDLDGSGNITGGQWTGISVGNHPQRLLAHPRVNENLEYIDYQEVLRIAKSRDDYLENNGSTELPPGRFNLVLLNKDTYRLAASKEDTARLTIAKQAGSELPVEAALYDGAGSPVQKGEVTEASSLTWQFEATRPPYTLELTQADYSDPNIYSLQLDLKKTFNREYPYLPKNGMWTGFVLTNPGSTGVDKVMLTTNDKSGQPLHTILGPFTLNAGEKKLVLFDNLPWRPHELPETGSLSLRADGSLNVVNLTGSNEQLLSQMQNGNGGSRFIIPETAPSFDPFRSLKGTLMNSSFQDAAVTFRVYSDSGSLRQVVQDTVSSRRHMEIRAGLSPFFDMPGDGWLEVRADNDTRINGFHILTESGTTEALFALPVSLETKTIPHIPQSGFWETNLILINPNDAENRLTLHPARAREDQSQDTVLVMAPGEKRRIALHEYYGFQPGDPLYRSIVEISGQLPFSGYFSYIKTENNEPASFPLIADSDLAGELVMPHYPSTGKWWTGIGIFNPLAATQDIYLEPYGEQGELLPDMREKLTITGGGYEIFTVSALFGDKADDISFIKIRTAEEGGLAGGFYLYGSKYKNGGVSGAVMGN